MREKVDGDDRHRSERGQTDRDLAHGNRKSRLAFSSKRSGPSTAVIEPRHRGPLIECRFRCRRELHAASGNFWLRRCFLILRLNEPLLPRRLIPRRNMRRIHSSSHEAPSAFMFQLVYDVIILPAVEEDQYRPYKGPAGDLALLSAQNPRLSLPPELAVAHTLLPPCCPPEHQRIAAGHDGIPWPSTSN
nr:hypothetical protein CFP56_31675 [Quercus suber]